MAVIISCNIRQLSMAMKSVAMYNARKKSQRGVISANIHQRNQPGHGISQWLAMAKNIHRS
jgi:hypothetical protein